MISMLNYVIIAWNSTYNWPLNSYLPNVTVTSFALANNFLNFGFFEQLFRICIFYYYYFHSSPAPLVPNVSDQCWGCKKVWKLVDSLVIFSGVIGVWENLVAIKVVANKWRVWTTFLVAPLHCGHVQYVVTNLIDVTSNTTARIKGRHLQHIQC